MSRGRGADATLNPMFGQFAQPQPFLQLSTAPMDFVTSSDRLVATMDKCFELATLHPVPVAFFLLVCLHVLRAAYREHVNPLRNISGPWVAKYTRFWVWKAVTSRDWHRTIVALHRQHGPVAQWYHVFTAPGEPEGMFTIRSNQQHLERRRQVNEFYTASAINKLAYRVDHVSQLLFDKLSHQARSMEKSPFDICWVIRLYAYDALANLTFGYVFSLKNNDIVSGLIEAIGAFIRYGMVVGPFVEWHPIIIRLLQALTTGSNKGMLHLKSIGENAMKNMDEYLDSSVSKDAGLNKGHQYPHSFVGVMQERHLKDPSTFTRDDVTSYDTQYSSWS
ncbi:MAG: hypothetical protein Q9178_007700 [Gyalolechia marmorata]